MVNGSGGRSVIGTNSKNKEPSRLTGGELAATVYTVDRTVALPRQLLIRPKTPA
jgi:hypothetical protein